MAVDPDRPKRADPCAKRRDCRHPKNQPRGKTRQGDQNGPKRAARCANGGVGRRPGETKGVFRGGWGRGRQIKEPVDSPQSGAYLRGMAAPKKTPNPAKAAVPA